jgi:D-alanyl-D-alanine carboxypeptidase
MNYYGGGGILSYTADLIDFYQVLFQGKIFDNPANLALMQKPCKYYIKPKLE